MRGYTLEMKIKLGEQLCRDINLCIGLPVTYQHCLKGNYTVLIVGDDILIDIPDEIFATTDYREIRLNVIAEIKNKMSFWKDEAK